MLIIFRECTYSNDGAVWANIGKIVCGRVIILLSRFAESRFADVVCVHCVLGGNLVHEMLVFVGWALQSDNDLLQSESFKVDQDVPFLVPLGITTCEHFLNTWRI